MEFDRQNVNYFSIDDALTQFSGETFHSLQLIHIDTLSVQ